LISGTGESCLTDFKIFVSVFKVSELVCSILVSLIFLIFFSVFKILIKKLLFSFENFLKFKSIFLLVSNLNVPVKISSMNIGSIEESILFSFKFDYKITICCKFTC